jgi:hypothetical protein
MCRQISGASDLVLKRFVILERDKLRYLVVYIHIYSMEYVRFYANREIAVKGI